MKSSHSRRGFTFVEVMITTAILGVVISVGSMMIIGFTNFYLNATARGEVQRDARNALDLVFKQLKQAKANTIVIDTYGCPANCQENYSWIQFTTIDGAAIQFYQNGNQFIMCNNGSCAVISTNLLYLAFAFTSSYSPNAVNVSVTMSKNVQLGRRTILQMEFQTVNVMN